MKNIALLSDTEREELFRATALKKNIRPEAVEKDFWVCYMIDHLFHDCAYKDLFVFKGGTSLSKSYHLISRFSEDIDLVLDWRKIITDSSDPWENRSKTKQDQYNKHLNDNAAEFYVSELVPALNSELGDKLKRAGVVFVDSDDEMVVNFVYPKRFDGDYLRPVIRLEIGPLAEWSPSHITTITPFAAEEYPNLFAQPETSVLTIDAEQSFWEKLTILHKLANFPENKSLPPRYARHLYDVYCMGNSQIKQKAFERKELLEKDVIFKQKFYYMKSSHYETANMGNILLVPNKHILKSLREDYNLMNNMIYGDVPSFDEVLQYLSKLQDEIHSLQ